MTVQVTVGWDNIELPGDLVIPADARGLVVFAHGSGSSRHSPRNQAVARELQDARFATLLLDLLTEHEELREFRFDIRLLADRLVSAVELARIQVPGLPVGLFGASTGGAAALVAAARRAASVRAVVCRGGRPDLAGGDALGHVRAPTLLIVGSLDQAVLELNEQAAQQMTALTQIDVVEGASHLFEEPGVLPEVARRAAEWFDKYLS
ncbi:alpha/beta hydrolase [Kibdelosporangium aridum]|uniref:Alpha/beta hydrolase n=1 Tax=Kibdelosporangium aridum TaxID=2030 RepID=A0A428ZCH0_KIBAR|nr:alpha/beta family hydrolase [Kibdelosporangium aridum]RSM85769.1 alpha/beta hydrolase [Kibdelosporangium aridum]